MSDRITATDFCRLFRNKIISTKDEFIAAWSNGFTGYITKLLKRIIKEDFGLQAYDESGKREYYNIDVIGWENLHDKIPKEKGFNKHLWDLKIAIEHENKSSDWMDEVVKLWFINSPLKVVISYSTEKNRDKLVDYVSCCLAKLSIYANGEFLLLLGHSGAKTNEEKLKYTPYLWDTEKTKFKMIPDLD